MSLLSDTSSANTTSIAAFTLALLAADDIVVDTEDGTAETKARPDLPLKPPAEMGPC